jgi:hypothetical protein
MNPSLVHEIRVGTTRLRVERDPATGTHQYYVDGRLRDVNAYLAIVATVRRPGDRK